jgi:L-ascorbate metabolism protein UlaG (beta-lactamase superfamily)
MIITRHGKGFLKLAFSDKTIALNPISKNSKEKAVRFGSDIAIANLFHPNFNGFDQVTSKGKEPFIIKGAGEYEISDIFIKGYGLKSKFEGADEMITSYTILLDGINLAIFGPINSGEEFSNEAFEEFAKADIFLVPIGGGDMFSPKEAAKFVKQFSPKIVIPILENNKDDLEEFASALGVELENEEEKLTIKTKDLPEEKTELRILKIV